MEVELVGLVSFEGGAGRSTETRRSTDHLPASSVEAFRRTGRQCSALQRVGSVGRHGRDEPDRILLGVCTVSRSGHEAMREYEGRKTGRIIQLLPWEDRTHQPTGALSGQRRATMMAHDAPSRGAFPTGWTNGWGQGISSLVRRRSRCCRLAERRAREACFADEQPPRQDFRRWCE
jgi:hypothetical protein